MFHVTYSNKTLHLNIDEKNNKKKRKIRNQIKRPNIASIAYNNGISLVPCPSL